MSAQPDDAQPEATPAEAMVWLPMAEPLDHDACPCGAPTGNGFCAEHSGAVAFKLPVTADGQVLPAVDWRWAHEQPCPSGESELVGSPTHANLAGGRVWACPHREHLPGIVTVPSAG